MGVHLDCAMQFLKFSIKRDFLCYVYSYSIRKARGIKVEMHSLLVNLNVIGRPSYLNQSNQASLYSQRDISHSTFLRELLPSGPTGYYDNDNLIFHKENDD